MYLGFGVEFGSATIDGCEGFGSDTKSITSPEQAEHGQEYQRPPFPSPACRVACVHVDEVYPSDRLDPERAEWLGATRNVSESAFGTRQTIGPPLHSPRHS